MFFRFLGCFAHTDLTRVKNRLVEMNFLEIACMNSFSAATTKVKVSNLYRSVALVNYLFSF